MREIKFRAWHTQSKYMATVVKMSMCVDYNYYDEYLYCVSDKVQLDMVIGSPCNDLREKYLIMQYTGLKDKKNVDCYEKDYDEDGNMIDWCDECCGYQFKLIDIPTGDEIFCHNCEGNFMLHDHIGDFEIVGNLPELMSGIHEA